MSRVLGRIVLAVVAVLLSGILLELGVRLYLRNWLSENSLERLRGLGESGADVPVRSSHPLAHIIRLSDEPSLVYELKPKLDLDFGHRRVVTNAEGLRESRDYPHQRSPKSVRIIGVGDSGMFGWNVEQGEDYLSVLEDTLAARGDGVLYDVLNFGVPGYNTQLEVATVRAKGLAYDPDVVIIAWCDNDYSLPFFFYQNGDFSRTDVSFLFTLIFAPARLAELAAGGVRDLRDGDRQRASREIAGGIDIEGVRASLAELRDLGAAKGFHTLIFGPIRREIAKIVQEVGIDAENTIESIPPKSVPKEWAVHAMHPRKEGHRLLGERLAAALDRRGWLVPRDAASASLDSR